MNNFFARFEHWAQQTPDAIALIGEDATGNNLLLSYAQLSEAVSGLSQWLVQQQIGRAGLWGENSIAWIVADLAALKAGVTLVPLPGFFSQAQLQHLIAAAELPGLLVCDQAPAFLATRSSLAARPALATSHADIYWVDLENTGSNSTGNSSPLPGICKITFTSGTTGTPKGVCLAAEALENTTQALAQRIYPASTVGSDIHRHFTLLPLSTLLENIAGVYVPLLLGQQIVVLAGERVGLTGSSQLSFPRLLAQLHHYQPQSLIVLPQILMGFVAAASQGFVLPASLTFVAVGGARTPANLLQRAQALAIPVYEGYGLSECASVVSLNAPGANKIGSVGKPLGHVQVRILDGAIQVSGNTFSGYLANPALGAVDQEPAAQPGAWLDTGDLGYLDDEGYLHVTGRRKNLLISSYGRNISPEWIEAELMLCRSIGQCLVVGDAQAFCSAIIVPADSSVAPAQIAQDLSHINQHLPDYARIQKFIVTSAPFTTANQLLTDNGRLKRAAIVAHYQDAIAAIYAAPPSDLSSHAAGVVYDVL